MLITSCASGGGADFSTAGGGAGVSSNHVDYILR